MQELIRTTLEFFLRRMFDLQAVIMKLRRTIASYCSMLHKTLANFKILIRTLLEFMNIFLEFLSVLLDHRMFFLHWMFFPLRMRALQVILITESSTSMLRT